MMRGAGSFNKAASEKYSSLEQEQGERLTELSKQPAERKSLTVKEIKRAGAKAFRKIQGQVGRNSLYGATPSLYV